MWGELSDNVIEEHEDGVLSVSYTHEQGLYGNLLTQNRNGETSCDHDDCRGDTVGLTDDSGNVTDTKDMAVCGNVIASTANTPIEYASLEGTVENRNLKTWIKLLNNRLFFYPEQMWDRGIANDPNAFCGGVSSGSSHRADVGRTKMLELAIEFNSERWLWPLVQVKVPR
jgi:hypothetical protein